MTVFGIYLVIFIIIGIAANLYYAGQGEVTYTRGILIFSSVWASINLLGILYFGTGSV